MWPEAAASNEAAWESSDAWMKRKKLSVNVRDYHSLHWLLYAYLQQGRYEAAEELLMRMKKVMSESTYDNKLRPGYYENNWANMAAAFIVETNDGTSRVNCFRKGKAKPEQAGMNGSHGGMHDATVRTSVASQTLPIFVRGMASAFNGSAFELHSIGPVNKIEVEALRASMKKDHANAIELMKKATALEEQMGAPYGPPALVVNRMNCLVRFSCGPDSRRRLPSSFKSHCCASLTARSLLGVARAAAQMGDRAAATAGYLKFLQQWKQADEGLAELREARDYLKQK